MPLCQQESKAFSISRSTIPVLLSKKKKIRSLQKADPLELSTKSVVVKFGLIMYHRLFTNLENASDVIREVTDLTNSTSTARTTGFQNRERSS